MKQELNPYKELYDQEKKKRKKLKEQLANQHLNDDLQELKWQLPTSFQEDKLRRELPIPRLEMRFRRCNANYGNEWYSVIWTYGIVYKQYANSDKNNLTFVPLGRTRSTGGDGTFKYWYKNGKLERPYRDIHHILAESKVFNFPVFIICDEMQIVQEISEKTEGFNISEAMLEDMRR